MPESAQSPDGVTYAGLQDISQHDRRQVQEEQARSQATGCKKGEHKLSTKLFFRNNGADAGGTATAKDGAPCKKK